jgi:hypothetical protein
MAWETRPALTPAQQYLFLQRNPICAGKGMLNAAGLRWEYYTRPTVISREFLVGIDFKRGGIPGVFVKEPDLVVVAEGRDLPHVYRDPLNLCLYLPNANEWIGSMRIDQTFVPWAATWLFYFEEWLASNEWKGGGEHLVMNEDGSSRRARRPAR